MRTQRSNWKGRDGLSIEDIRQQTDQLTFDMQRFCLAPTAASFDRICGCAGLRAREGDDFVVWRDACLWKYGERWLAAGWCGWCLQNGAGTSAQGGAAVALRAVQEAFARQYAALRQRRGVVTKNKADKLLHIFFATGDGAALETYIEYAGDERLSWQARETLADIFIEIRTLYTTAVALMPPGEVEALGLRRDVVDFSYFDKLRSEWTREE